MDILSDSPADDHANDFIPDMPAMTSAEIELVDRFVAPGVRVLEFGSGGSTLFFVRKHVQLLTTVESDIAWLRALLTHSDMAAFQQAKKWTAIYADIGPVGDWGAPTTVSPQASWCVYHHNVWAKMPDRHFDAILIDGRFRIACCMQSVLRCTNPDAILLVHDFWVRPAYHVILPFFEIVARADTAVALRRKEQVDYRALCLLLQEHQFDYL